MWYKKLTSDETNRRTMYWIAAYNPNIGVSGSAPPARSVTCCISRTAPTASYEDRHDERRRRRRAARCCANRTSDIRVR